MWYLLLIIVVLLLLLAYINLPVISSFDPSLNYYHTPIISLIKGEQRVFPFYEPIRSTRNMSYDLRGDPFNPYNVLTPFVWNNSEYGPF